MIIICFSYGTRPTAGECAKSFGLVREVTDNFLLHCWTISVSTSPRVGGNTRLDIQQAEQVRDTLTFKNDPNYCSRLSVLQNVNMIWSNLLQWSKTSFLLSFS